MIRNKLRQYARETKDMNGTDISWDAGCIAGECIDDPTGAQLLGL